MARRGEDDSLEVETATSLDDAVGGRRSLLFRVGLAMAGVTLLAIVSMLTSVFIAETSRGDAAAINLAGSLRMQAYRLAADLGTAGTGATPEGAVARDVAAFRESLDSPVIRSVLPDSRRGALWRSYDKVQREWRDRLQPLAAKVASAPERAELLAAIPGYVDDIDHMVRLLQRDAESKIQLLRLVQGIALFLTLILVFFSMYRLMTEVMPPLRELLDAFNAARRGDLTVRTSYRGSDELGLLAQTYNRMADRLEGVYREQERRVAQKTASLEQSNRALRLLYDASRELAREPLEEADYRSLLQRMRDLLDSGPITLCLAAPDSPRAYRRITAGTAKGGAPEFCRAPECGPCLDADNGPSAAECLPGVTRVPLMEAGRRYGSLLLAHDPDRPPTPWQLQICETIGGHIAMAQSLREREAERNRLALMDERAVIARELHDSLAQALSYLKIQVARLQAELRHDTPAGDNITAIIGDLRGGLTDAYRQLRELLSTFRLRLTEGGLEEATRAAVKEFSARGEIPIDLDYHLHHCPLSPNEELHLVHLLREALANVVQHAHARRAHVSLGIAHDADVVMTVDDDGRGLPEHWPEASHYGTTIMQERARSLGGSVAFGSAPAGGTRVMLRFRPRIHDQSPENSVIA